MHWPQGPGQREMQYVSVWIPIDSPAEKTSTYTPIDLAKRIAGLFNNSSIWQNLTHFGLGAGKKSLDCHGGGTKVLTKQAETSTATAFRPSSSQAVLPVVPMDQPAVRKIWCRTISVFGRSLQPSSSKMPHCTSPQWANLSAHKFGVECYSFVQLL